MLNPFIDLISNIISLVNMGLLLWIVLGLLIQFDIVNRYNPLVSRIYSALSRLFEPLLAPIRTRLNRVLPNVGIDFAPIALFLLLHFIDSALHHWLYTPQVP